MKSTTLPIYTKWLATATPDEVEKVDAIYAACEKNYSAGGDIVVETQTPCEVLELGSVEAARKFCETHNEMAANARWGEDSDPEVNRPKWEG